MLGRMIACRNFDKYFLDSLIGTVLYDLLQQFSSNPATLALRIDTDRQQLGLWSHNPNQGKTQEVIAIPMLKHGGCLAKRVNFRGGPRPLLTGKGARMNRSHGFGIQADCIHDSSFGGC